MFVLMESVSRDAINFTEPNPIAIKKTAQELRDFACKRIANHTGNKVIPVWTNTNTGTYTGYVITTKFEICPVVIKCFGDT